ncbi:hypothetical protein HGP17_14860 [Rhizobium sp. P38BS-XIX]|uniref:hypothetical protein n=1 Tax=Rhizobium sp. P38BS-XIX TaxID=2726740 RepID=UPI001456B131|nr:hypothetical protein [Rhizobium sp. P38BS-XIX]NLR98093.1 hypothetical protein [Rhizobium sp. P38BS-XIX]
MLHKDDHKLFEEYFLNAEESCFADPRPPRKLLAAAEGGLHAADLRRLSHSIKILASAGLMSEAVAITFGILSKDVSGDRYVGFDHPEAWMEAICWAKKQPDFLKDPSWPERVVYVGKAAGRLMKRGYRIEASAFGPYASLETVKQICDQVISLVKLLGGASCAQQIFRVLVESKAVHDGFFIFGNRVSSTPGEYEPAYPWGWLLTLAIANLGSPGSANKPEVAWKTLTDLARDFAAIHDCQRYSQYEQMAGIPPEEFERVLRESITWRELFSLPQAPQLIVMKIGDALKACLKPVDEEKLGFKLIDLLNELRLLLVQSHDTELRLFASGPVRASHPILWREAFGNKDKVNPGYKEPADSHRRNQDRFLIFEAPDNSVALLPRPLAVNAACEMLFRLIWQRLPKARAAEVTGQVLELAIAAACREKSPPIVAPDVSYERDNHVFQLDVGTRDEGALVLFETKAKSLTAKARSGIIYSGFIDYADSFLAMLKQLVRHDFYLRKTGLPPLTSGDDKTEDLTVFKVAVSPLSYGPIMDRLLTANAMPAILGRRFGSLSPMAEDVKAIEDFNAATTEVLDRLAKIAPTNDRGELDLFPYFIDVYWMDLGQLLYALDRAPSVSAAFRPLKHLTFGTRDFWTEIAFADIQLLTGRHGWRQPRVDS